MNCEFHPDIEATHLGSTDTTTGFKKHVNNKTFFWPSMYFMCNVCAVKVVESDSEDKELFRLHKVV